MDQYLDNRQKEILWDLLANPADTGSSYTQSLERLVHENPQSGILQVLFARTGTKQQLSKAAVYYNPRTLHKLINHPQELAEVGGASIIPSSVNFFTGDKSYFNGDANTEAAKYDDIQDEPQQAVDTEEIDEPQAEPADDNYRADTTEEPEQIIEEDNEADKPYEADTIIVKTAEETPDSYHHQFETGEQPAEVEDEPVTEASAEEPGEQVTEETTAHDEPQVKEEKQGYTSRFPKREVKNDYAAEPEYPQQQGIDDDVYDEIVSIEDIGFEAIASEEHTAPAHPVAEARFSDPSVETGPEEEEASAVLFHQQQPVVEPVQNYDTSINEQEERLILGGIVNADYLSFDKKLDELRNATPAEDASNVTGQQQTTPPAAETQELSRYDDDKMPYTFMWWLDKTRKEHADTFQPYADKNTNGAITPGSQAETAGRKTGMADELQQQYYENIFSLTSVSGVGGDAEPAPVAFDHNKKEDVIIERFIHTEPQIKPLSADKLDNENKAKKSSEDQNELVTETLARIYHDQMLYHKAIATYKKLILKFPEKKLYFASQIEQLEKKTN